MVLGEIVRADLGSGLQSQTYNLCRMLKPSKLCLIDSRPFNKNELYPEMYNGFQYIVSDGFITNRTAMRFMRDLTHIITAETFYSHFLVSQCRARGIKTFQQFNYEFCEHLQNSHLPKLYKWLSPSYWHLEEMEAKFDNVVYLPPPIFVYDFKEAREANFNRTGRRRFVHVMGKVASHDRNGTLDLLAALEYSKADFELVIRSQFPVPEYMDQVKDPRVRFEIRNFQDPQDLYRDFDLMIMPRRYGGLCLPMNEALCSGLPVMMPDISPNNKVLPLAWLIPAEKVDEFMARTKIDIHASHYMDFGQRLDWFANMSDKDLSEQKAIAFELGYNNYSSDILKPIYEKELEL